MPRTSKGTRLYLKPARRDGEDAIWCVRDGRNLISTGLGSSDRAGAEKWLAEYLAKKYQPVRRNREIEQVKVADVIAIYLENVVPYQETAKSAGGRATRLLEFFGTKMLSDINGALCREYAKWRGSDGGARRDLQDLAAAINHHLKQGYHREIVKVSLPAAGHARLRWLTRSEVARLLWVCLTTKEIQEGSATTKRPLRHLARFILTGVYTGSRPGSILALSWHHEIGRGYVDTENGLIYRLAAGARKTNKRQPPVPMAPALSRHMARWKAIDGHTGPVIRWQGKSVLSVKVALGRAVKLAGLDTAVTAYTLRHTTGSWLIQKGVSTRKVAEILGTSEAMVERHYGHLAPDHLRDEVAIIGRK
jgi:integrase